MSERFDSKLKHDIEAKLAEQERLKHLSRRGHDRGGPQRGGGHDRPAYTGQQGGARHHNQGNPPNSNFHHGGQGLSQGRHEYNNRRPPYQGAYPPDGSRTVTELSVLNPMRDRRQQDSRDGGGHAGHEMERRGRVDEL